MILLRGTQKFLSFTGIRPEVVSGAGHDAAFSSEWNVNLFYHERKKHLLVTHCTTLFTFLVTDVRKKDTADLLGLFRKGLSRAMFHTHCPAEMMQKVLKDCDGIVVSKTVDRSVLASMNDLMDKSRWWLDQAEEAKDPAAAAAVRLNVIPLGALKFKSPIEVFSASYGFKVKPDLKGVFEAAPQEDLDTFLRRELGENAVLDLADAPASRIAQELIYEAWERVSAKERVRLARKALTLDTQCADAYLILGDEAKYTDEAFGHYLQGAKVGKEALGEQFFKENTGSFWGLTSSRPYMRVLAALQAILWEMKKPEEALQICRDMLRLNPNDNQGMRYVLIRYLAKLSRFLDLEKFMEEGNYVDDCAAEWCYTRALVWFLKEGATVRSNRLLKRALLTNKWVPQYLPHKIRLDYLPDALAMGEEEEAQFYAQDFGGVWRKSTGALEWLRDQAGPKE